MSIQNVSLKSGTMYSMKSGQQTRISGYVYQKIKVYLAVNCPSE